MASADMFLMIKGIQGEETEPKNAIRIESWSWGETGGQGKGKVHMDDLHVQMKVNGASPKLLEYCATGKPIDDATLTCREAGTGQKPYLDIKLLNCRVSFFHSSADASSSIAMDRFSLSFEKIEYTYKLPGAKKLRDGGNVGAKYDLTKWNTY